MAEFFDTFTPNISIHISEILKDKALQENTVVKHYLTTASDDKIIRLRSILWKWSLQSDSEAKSLEDAVSAVGVQSGRVYAQGLCHGWWMSEKTDGRPDDFDELLERIRDIRASEKCFYQKVWDLFALSCDYNKYDQETQMFLRKLRNLFMLWPKKLRRRLFRNMRMPRFPISGWPVEKEQSSGKAMFLLLKLSDRGWNRFS